ncbi:16706_t:CDS:1, partial [Dentiscutata heterogama]
NDLGGSKMFRCDSCEVEMDQNIQEYLAQIFDGGSGFGLTLELEPT